jgi:signal peptidase I
VGGGEALADSPRAKSFLERTNAEDDAADAQEASAARTTTPPGRRADIRGATAKPRRGGGPAWLRFAIVVVLAIGVAFGLRTYVVAPYYIPSQSMEPTLHGCTPHCNNDHVLVDKLSYHLHSVHRGDVVVFNLPKTWHGINDKVLIKRVIGLPGDVLTLKNGDVYVNGQQLQEPYVKDCGGVTTTLGPANTTITTTAKVPPGQLFVMGDNRCESDDSRTNGTIPRSSIIGRAFVIIWPLGRIHYL